MSWSVGSHVMNNLAIQYSGNWFSDQSPDGVYDRTVAWNTDYIGGSGVNRAGCQIPQSWAWYTVYTNCRFGIGL